MNEHGVNIKKLDENSSDIVLNNKQAGGQIYKLIIDSSSDAIFLIKSTGQIIDVNNAAEQMFGYTKEDFLVLGERSILDQTSDNLQALFTQRKETGKVIVEQIGITKSGFRFPIGYTSSVFTDDFGEEFNCTVIHDITGRRKVEQEMLLMLNNTDESFLLLNKELLILNYSKKFKDLYEKYFNIIIEKGFSILSYVQPNRTKIVAEICKQALLGTDMSQEVTTENADGTKNYFTLKYSPSKCNEDDIIGVFVTAKNITTEKNAIIEIAERQALLEQAENTFREIFEKASDGIIIHEIGTGRLVDINEKACEIFEAKKDFILSEHPEIFMADQAGFSFGEVMEKVVNASEGEPQFFDWQCKSLNDNSNWFEVKLQKANIAGTDRILTHLRVINDRKNAEVQMGLEQKDKEALINNMDDLIWSIDCDYKLIVANNAYLHMMYHVAETPHKVGDTVMIEEFGESINNKWKVYYQRALAGEKFSIEEEFMHPKTKKHSYELVSFNPIFKDENVVGVACSSKNITELKENQIALKATNEELDSVMASSQDMICTVASDDRIVRVSAASEIILGYKPEELIGKFIFDFVYHEDKEKTKNQTQVVLGGQPMPNYYNRYVRKDGSLVYLEWTAKWDAQSNKRYGVARDVTAKIEAENKLKLSEQRFRNLVQDGSDLIGILGHDATYKYVSPTSFAILGYEPDEFTGKSAFDFIHHDDIQNVQDHFALLQTTKKITLPHFRFKNKKGEWRWMDTTLTNLMEEPAINGIVANSRDITERKNDELQKELLRKIRIIFNEPFSIVDTLDRVLKEVTLFGQFSFAESWLLSADKKEIKRATYYAADAALRQTLTHTSILNSQKKGEGLLGAAWQTLEMQEWESDTHSVIIMDEQVLINAGIKKLYALPFLYNTEIIGVLVFALDKNENTINKLDNLFSSLKSYIGAEIKRKHLEQELNQIFNFAPDIIAIIGNDGYFKKLNPAASSMLEYSLKELMARPLIDFVHPEDHSETYKKLDDVITGKATFYFETRYITKSGKIKWLAWTCSPSQEEELIFAVAKNITEKKDLEVVLGKANQLARMGSWEFDVEMSALFWSDITKEIHEVSFEFLPSLENAMQAYKEGNNRDLMVIKVNDALKNGTPWDVELEIITDKGNEKWIRSIGETEFIDGKCVKVYGSVQDIDERKRAEENIRSSEERRELIMNNALDAIICFDKHGDVTFWNPQAVSIFGWQEEEVLGQKLSCIILPERDRVQLEEGMKHYFKTGASLALNKLLQLSALRKSGEEFPVELSVLPIQQNDEEFFCAFVRDITERKSWETQLLQLNQNLQRQTHEMAAINKELEQFAYVASHDLQEPLRMVTSFITLLQKKYDHLFDEKGKKYIYFAVDGASRMRQMILDLLEFSKIGRNDELKEHVDLNEIVEEIQILYNSKIEEQKAIILTEKLPILQSYKSPIRQVFQNIISNSLKYSNQNKPCLIEIHAKEVDNYWEFSIKDNGIGIGKDYFDKIFVIFQRLHTKEVYSGNGMGLSVTKKIIENLNGKIWVESVEGEGSVFFFTIPNTETKIVN
jgi:PAS domain S-box-containing protein